MKHRTPIRPSTAEASRRSASFPDYPVSPRIPVNESPQLSPRQIPLVEDADGDLPTDTEVAEALGIGASELHADIQDEERQRHPDVHGEDEDAASVAAVADEFHHRLSGGRRR